MTRRSPLVAALVALLLAAALAGTPAGASPGTGDAGPEATTSLVSLSSMSGLDTGSNFTCGISAKEVYCWGLDTLGQLGNGPGNTPQTFVGPVAVSGTPLDGKAIEQVVTGYHFACALTDDDVVACWGNNNNGQLGDGTTTGRSAPVAVALAGSDLDGADILELVASNGSVCALISGGKVGCWGYGPATGTGAGATTNVTSPTLLATSGTPLDGATVGDLAAGGYNTCATTTGGAVACWGQNSSGQIGDDTTTLRTVPTAVTTTGTPLDGKTVAEVAVGRYTTCARTSDDVLACWGKNAHGQVGDGTTTDRHVPTAVTVTGTPLATSAPAFLTAGMEQQCAVLDDSTIVCWGENNEGQLGDGTTTDRHVPTAVAVGGTTLDGDSIKEITNGDEHGCATPSDAQPACWGKNTFGALGTGTETSTATPVPVVLDPQVPGAPTNVTAIPTPTGDEVTVSWTPPSDDGGVAVSSYLLRVYQAGTSTLETFGSPASGPSTFGLPPGDYEVTVAAVNAVGDGPESARSAAFTIVEPPPELPDGALYVPMTPCRILDTRQAGGTLANREIRDIAVADDVRVEAQGGKAGGCDVPSAALAIEASVAAVDPADSGFFRAWPFGESMPNATFMNFDRGMDITNTGSIAIAPAPGIEGAVANADGDQLRIRNFGGASHYVIDVQGFYLLPPQEPADGAPATTSAVDLGDTAIYQPITPCRILDTRQAGGTLANREIRDIAVADDVRVAAQGGKADGCDLPAEALAIEASITAVDPADSGFFRAWPFGESMPNATFMNFDRGMDITNTGSIAIASQPAMPSGAATNAEGDQLRIRNFGGASHYVIDVQGVWLPAFGAPANPNDATTSAVTDDPSLYEPMTPCRILDTRQAGGTLANREIRDISFTDDARVAAQGGKADGCDVPIGTVAVEVSITAVDPADSGFFRAWPAGESMPNATFMNFDRGMDITNTGSITIAYEEIMGGATTSALGDELRIRNFGGASHYVIDIQGYYPGLGRMIES